MRKPKTSRLSLQSTLNRVTEERDAFQQALEDIADILEDCGILESGEDVEDPPDAEPDIIPGTAEEVE